MTSAAQRIAVRQSDLEAQASEFAARVNYTLQGVLGYEGPLVHTVARRNRVTVTTVDTRGLDLRVSETDIYRLKVQYHCELSESRRYLAVELSSFKVFHKDFPEPIVTFDYVRKPKGTIPAAHINVHAEGNAFHQAFADSGDSGRARARKKRGNNGRLGELHFPVGGHRFRPCLEDVLEMLIDEFAVDVTPGWRTSLIEGRMLWREVQLKAAISDYPEAAVQALEEQGFAVEWIGSGERPRWRPDRLEAF